MMTFDDPESIRTALTDPSGPAIPDVQSAAKNWEAGSLPAATKGITGLLLFCAAAEPFMRERIPGLLEPGDYLSSPDVKAMLFAEYDVPQTVVAELDDLDYYRLGTTSIILRSGCNFVLKIIKPWFWDVASISDATAGYKKNYGGLGSVAPRVVDSHRRWIFMNFVEGQTLTEFIERELRPLRQNPRKTNQFLSLVHDIFAELCASLNTCAERRPGIHHLDLSPDNIIVDVRRHKVHRVTLIDFGVNYLLLTHLGTSERVSRAGVFVAPELQNGADGDSLTDIYSLGLILLEMLAPDFLSKTDTASALDDAWIAFPEVAANIEDMIDRTPSNRLVQDDGLATTPFTYISDAVSHSVNLFVKTKMRPASVLDLPLEIINSALPFKPVKEAWDQFKVASEDLGKPLRWVFLWGLVAQSLHIFVLSLLFWTTFHFTDRRLCDITGSCISTQSVPPLPFPDGAMGRFINGYAPGRLMAFTFSLIVAKYYSELFGLITLRYLHSVDLRAKARTAEVLMRSVPVAGSIPLLYGLIVDPKAWAFCASLGLLLVALNNRVMYNFLCWGQGQLFPITRDSALPSSRFVADQLKEYRRWFSGIFIYSISLSVLGLCIWAGIAQDEWLYALFAGVFVNLGVIYRVHCHIRPPDLRIAFSRVVSRLRRLDRVKMTVQADSALQSQVTHT